MNTILKTFGKVIGYLVSIHLAGLLALSICRLILLFANMPAEGVDWQLLPTALLIGVKFDNLIASYITALPAIVLPVFALATMRKENYGLYMRRLTNMVAWYYGVTYALLILIHVSNARYFHFFDNHLNIGVTAWFGFAGDTAGMIFEDITNRYFLVTAILLIGLYECGVVALNRSFASVWQRAGSGSAGHYILSALITVLLWGVVFCGIRGSFQRYPLQVSFAYFCNNPFYNRLGVNPVFNIIKSAEHGLEKMPPELEAIDEQKAITYVQDELHIHPIDSLLPLVRRGTTAPRVQGRPNVVLIFMESMTVDNLELQSNGQWLTPYLRSLRDKSIYWANCFSTGVHTNNGIVGVHYGFVPNFAKPAMGVNAEIYTGLPYYLRKNGYQTLCFVTGNPQYDNMNSFWRDNHIHDLYSLYDYEADSAVNNFGVSDGYMFRYGIRKLGEYAESGKPFFASFLTVSNHSPFVVPEAYRCRGENDEQRIIAYADDAIRRFMEAAQQTEWGKNTVFVLVADHGSSRPSPYDMTLSYNHIPVFIYSGLLQPERIERVTSQIDIWESVLSLLGLEYDNNCTGIDVFSARRRYAYFVSNEHLGVSDGTWFWCYGIHSKQEKLYRIGSGENILDEFPEKAADMRAYGMNMMRVNLLIIDKQWTKPCE